jgi:hypothetical protein
MPVQLWALLLAFMGVVLAIVVLETKAEATISQAVLSIAASLVSGAIGAFAGHAIGASKADVTTGNAPVTINQLDPK